MSVLFDKVLKYDVELTFDLHKKEVPNSKIYM